MSCRTKNSDLTREARGRHGGLSGALVRSALAMGCAGGVIAANVGVASAGTSHLKASGQSTSARVIKPDLKYYRGKALTFITGGAPGGSFQYFAEAVAPAMAAYLHATVNVEDIQPGATVPAADASAAAPPNGLTIGDGNLVQFIASDITHQSTVNYTLKTVQYIGGQGPNSTIILTNKASHLTRLQTLLKTSGIKWVLTGGAPETAELLLSKAYRQPDAVFLPGYPTGAASEEGLLRGDGQVTGLSIAESVSLVQSGQANGVLLTSPVPKGTADYAQLSKIPLLATYVKDHEPKSKADRTALQDLINFELFPADIVQAPKATPPQYVAALRAAYKFAMSQKSVRQKLTFGGFSSVYVAPPQVLRDIDVLTTPKVESFMEPYLLG